MRKSTTILFAELATLAFTACVNGSDEPRYW